MADQNQENQDSRLARLTEENAALQQQLEEQKQEINNVMSTVEQLREDVRLKEEALEKQEKINADLTVLVESHKNAASVSWGDSSDVSEVVLSDKDSEIARLKKRNVKLEKDIRSLKDRYNTQSKELTKKANLPAIEKTLKEIERWELQTSNLKANLQGIIQEAKLSSKSESKQATKAETKQESKSAMRGDDVQSTLSRDLRQEFHNGQSVDGTRSVEVEIWTPGEVETEWESLELHSGEHLWADFISKLSNLDEEMKNMPVAVIQWGEFFLERDEVVKSIQVLNPRSQVSEFVTTSGDVMESDKATHSFRHFLHPNEPVLFSPGQISILTVMTRCRVMCELHSGRRYYQLGEVSLERIFDPHSLVLIFGLHLKNNDTRQETIFIQLNGRQFCESKTGRVYESEAEVYAGFDRAEFKYHWSCLMILICDGDRIPYCKVPDTPITAFTRYGANVHIERGRVFARTPISNAREGTWTMKKAINNFDQQLMRAMRAHRG